MGRVDEYLTEFTTALHLDPLSPLKLAALGWSYYFARRFENAIAECRRGVELDPEFVVSRCWLGLALEGLGATAQAVTEFEMAVRLSGRSPAILGFLGHGYASAGRVADARRLLNELLGLRQHRYISAFDIGLIHLGLGDTEAAMTWLEQAETERAHQMAFLKVDPRLDPLRDTSRFRALLVRMGFDGPAPAPVKPGAANARSL
jgi:tetratricopeptide (TPR) repeat protein